MVPRGPMGQTNNLTHRGCRRAYIFKSLWIVDAEVLEDGISLGCNRLVDVHRCSTDSERSRIVCHHIQRCVWLQVRRPKFS